MGQARSDPRPSRAWAFHSLQKGKEKFHFFAKKENLTNKNHNIILHLRVVNLSCNTYAMKFVIFKEIFFSDTQFFNEMFEKSNVHEENVQKIVILIAKCPKNGEFQGIFFFASFSLQRIFFAQNAKKIFFAKNLQSIDCHHHHFFNYKKIFVFARV